MDVINAKDNYYTTSSCSGRVYFWQGSGKKNETEWLKVSHDLIAKEFFDMKETGLIWLRFEPMILHVCCINLDTANALLDKARNIYKKSCIISASNKIIVEIRGSEFLEMPFLQEGKQLFSGDLDWLLDFINQKLKKNWSNLGKLKKEIEKLNEN